MAIYREGSEIRVERDEKSTRVGAAAGAAAVLFVAGYFGTLSDSATDWMIVAAVLLIGLSIAAATLRRRNVCIVRPDQVGWGNVGRELTWFERGDLRYVKIVNNLVLQVQFYDGQDQLRQAFTLTNFKAAELRESFEEMDWQVR